jgi:hypothetical protein
VLFRVVRHMIYQLKQVRPGFWVAVILTVIVAL